MIGLCHELRSLACFVPRRHGARAAVGNEAQLLPKQLPNTRIRIGRPREREVETAVIEPQFWEPAVKKTSSDGACWHSSVRRLHLAASSFIPFFLHFSGLSIAATSMKPPYPSLTPTWHNDVYPAIEYSSPGVSHEGQTIVVTGAVCTPQNAKEDLLSDKRDL